MSKPIEWTTCADIGIKLCFDCSMRASLKSGHYFTGNGCAIMQLIGIFSCMDDPNTMSNLHYHSLGIYSIKDKMKHILKCKEDNALYLHKSLEIAHPEYLSLFEEVINDR